MSAASHSPSTKQPLSDRVIPIRRVPLSDQSQLPSDYGTTPGGTLFSTTPGGTRIIYDRDFLLQCRNSPLTKSPPANLPNIPGITDLSSGVAQRENVTAERGAGDDHTVEKKTTDDAQFPIDI
jgi:translation initiation factor 4E binding protein 1